MSWLTGRRRDSRRTAMGRAYAGVADNGRLWPVETRSSMQSGQIPCVAFSRSNRMRSGGNSPASHHSTSSADRRPHHAQRCARPCRSKTIGGLERSAREWETSVLASFLARAARRRSMVVAESSQAGTAEGWPGPPTILLIARSSAGLSERIPRRRTEPTKGCSRNPLSRSAC